MLHHSGEKEAGESYIHQCQPDGFLLLFPSVPCRLLPVKSSTLSTSEFLRAEPFNLHFLCLEHGLYTTYRHSNRDHRTPVLE